MPFEFPGTPLAVSERNDRVDHRIRLPEDAGRQKILQSKLVEYEGRLSSNDRKSDVYIDARYKMRLLTRLLEDGFVSAEQIREECEEDFGNGFKPNLFERAVQVIESYCSAHFVIPKKLELNPDSDIRGKLKSKLSDYQSRLDPSIPSEQQDADAAYKYLILSELLERGVLDVKSLYQSLKQQHGEAFDSDVFMNAVKVVEHYNNNDTSSLVGGKGF